MARVKSLAGRRRAEGAIQPYRSPNHNKKGYTGARAGVGHAGRQAGGITYGATHPRGPGSPPQFPSVRLPNQSTGKSKGVFSRIVGFFRGK